MKKKYLIFCIFINITAILFGIENEQEHDQLWGVWNFNKKSEQIYTTSLSTGEYETTFLFLAFEPNYKNRGIGRVSYDGGYYNIDKVISSEDGFHVFLKWSGWIKNPKGEFVEATIPGEVAVHFLTEDTIWLELVQGVNTHEKFPSIDFQGKERILWRGRKIEPEN